MAESEGMRRLSHALGVLGATGWAIYVTWAVAEHGLSSGLYPIMLLLGYLIVGATVIYGLLWGAVQLTDWVWIGFQEDEE